MTISQRKQLRKVRPPLSIIAPLTHKIILGFVVFNLWLGWIIFSSSRLDLVIITGYFNQIFWAAIYWLIAFWLIFGLIDNDWAHIRWAMSAGVMIKTIWTYAIIYLGYQTSFNSIQGTLILWLFAAWVQVVTVIYFTPGGTHARNSNI